MKGINLPDYLRRHQAHARIVQALAQQGITPQTVRQRQQRPGQVAMDALADHLTQAGIPFEREVPVVAGRRWRNDLAKTSSQTWYILGQKCSGGACNTPERGGPLEGPRHESIPFCWVRRPCLSAAFDKCFPARCVARSSSKHAHSRSFAPPDAGRGTQPSAALCRAPLLPVRPVARHSCRATAPLFIAGRDVAMTLGLHASVLAWGLRGAA